MHQQDEVVRIQPTKKRGGSWLVIGEEEYRIPPLGFFDIQELKDDIDSLKGMGGIPSPEQFDSIGKIITASFHRNYPDMAEADIRDMIDLGNFQTILATVMNNSGMVKVPVGGDSVGEVKASTGV